MTSQKPENQNGNTLVVSSEMLKDSDFRSRPVNSLSFDTASEKDETKEKEESALPDKDEPDEQQDDETEGSENESSSDDDSTTPPKKSKGLEKRFKKLTAERTSLKEQNDLLLARLADIEARLAGSSKKEEPKAKSDFTFDKPKPKLDDFDTVADFNEAIADWKYDQRKAQDKHEEQVSQQRQSGDNLFKTFFSKGKNIEKELGLESGEWDATVRDDTFKVSTAAAYAAAEMDGNLGAHVLYHIASDEETRSKFEAMNERQQVAFIGKLEAKFEVQEELKSKGGNKNDKVITKAKPPGKSIKGSSNTVKFDRSRSVNELAGSVDIKSQADFKRLRNQHR